MIEATNQCMESVQIQQPRHQNNAKLCRSGIFFEQISHTVPVFTLLTLNT